MLGSRVKTNDGERGQVLILFVALFSVVLLLGAFAIDQGLWLNHRRIAQKDADAAARAGASAYLQSISDGELTPSSATYATAQARAIDLSAANGAGTTVNTPPTFDPGCDASTTTTCARSDCPTQGATIDGAPSVEIAVPRPAPGLFVRALGGGDATDIGAKSTACVGSALAVSPSEIEGIPLELRTDDSASVNCFPGGVIATGNQCAVKLDATGSTPRGLFIVPDATACDGSGGGSNTVANGVVTGINFTCDIYSSGGCTDTTCVNPLTGDVGNNILTAFQDRLARTNTCSADNFPATFDYADGLPGPVLGPPGLGSPVNTYVAGQTDPNNTVYQTKACFSPRTALVVLSDGSGEHVTGFAAIYIVGCFQDTDALTNALNNCSGGGIPPGHAELRMVIVHILLTGSSIGGIGPPTPNSPLVIQTTR